MSAEFYPRRLLLENNPALRAQVEKVVTVSDCSENDAAEPNNGDMQHADWPQPQPLGDELPAVQGFDVVLLPGSLRPLVTDTADRMQVPSGVVVIRDELSACSPRWISLDVKVNVGSFSLRGMATPVIPLIGSGVALSMLTPVVCRC